MIDIVSDNNLFNMIPLVELSRRFSRSCGEHIAYGIKLNFENDGQGTRLRKSSSIQVCWKILTVLSYDYCLYICL